MISLGPLPAFNFYIALIDPPGEGVVGAISTAADYVLPFVLGGFSEAQGLESEIAVEQRTVGGVNDRVFQFPGRASYSNITLTRGVGFGEDLYLWHESFLKGEGKRKKGMIFLANELRVPIKAWTFENGIPIKWSGPSMNASSSALAIEKLEIAHERLELTMSPGKALADIGSELGFGG